MTTDDAVRARARVVMLWVDENIDGLGTIQAVTLMKYIEQHLKAHAAEATAELEKQLQKWKRIRTPTHGPCCTCQQCGEYYEECRCDLDEVADELEQTKQQLAEAREDWDWLELNLTVAGPEDGNWELRKIPGDPINGFQIQRQLKQFSDHKTLRDAVRDARRGQDGGSTP